MMTSLTRWVLAYRRLVVALWAVVAIVGIATVGKASSSFDQKFSVPGREGWETANKIASIYKTGGDNMPLLPVVKLPAGTTVSSPGVRADLAKVDRAAARVIPDARIASYASTGDKTFASKDGRTVFSVVYPKPPDTAF